MAINAPPEKRKNRTSDNVIYIGAERKDRIDQMTIEISYSTKRKVSTARLVIPPFLTGQISRIR